MEEEAERANKKVKTEVKEDGEDAKEEESDEYDEDEVEYSMKVETWTNDQIIHEYNRLCEKFHQLHESVLYRPYDGKRATMYEHLDFYQHACDTQAILRDKMEIVLGFADERRIPGDRSEGKRLSEVRR